MEYTVFEQHELKSHLARTPFLDGVMGVARYDQVKYPFFDKLTEKQLGFFWRPEEVEVTRDAADFKNLTEQEQHIFTSNLKRQILLDSLQGRSPTIAFQPLVSVPELEVWIQAWAFFETIHSRSYSHIIRNIYSNPSEIFDTMMSIEEIADCAKDISKYYDELIEHSMYYQLFGEGTHTVRSGEAEKTIVISRFELKRRLWRALMSVNVLEGIRFYVSFACSWAFAEQKKMEGNAKIIKFIARDENLHLASTHQLIKTLPKEDPDFAIIAKEEEELSIQLFKDAVEQEKTWARYLFKDGSMVGLNYDMLSSYVEWIAYKRMHAINLPQIYKGGANPLPWTQKWISGSEVQVAPQETEISSYIVGGVKKDVTATTFQGFSL